MDGASIGIMGLVVVNIAVAAYGYGKLNQKVDDQGRRLDRLEKRLNSKGKSDG